MLDILFISSAMPSSILSHCVTAFAPTPLNISTVTSIFGAPVVILMMLRRSKGKR